MSRLDGRTPAQLRPIKITRNYLKYAEGSCLIEAGHTRVICTASIEEKVPPFLMNTGTGWITAEYGMLPRSVSSRIPRQRAATGGRTHEIQRLVGRSLRSVADMKALGSRTINIDCDVIQGDGGTRTAAITGSFVALVDAMNFLRRSGAVEKIPVKDFVAAVSVGVVDGDVLLDLNYEEDSHAEVDMNIVMTGGGAFVEVQGTAEQHPFGESRLVELLAAAKQGIAQVIRIQKEALSDIRL